MKRLYQYYARELGERPALVVAILVLLSGILYVRLVWFVLKTRGIFGLTPEQSACLMGVLIALVCGVLLWRMAVADQRLRTMVLGKYREAIRLIDSKAKATTRDLAGRLGMKKNLHRKVLRLISLTPEPFIALILVLASVNFFLYLAFEFLPYGDGERKLWNDIYANCPWAFAIFIIVYVIYNDIKVMESLKRLVDSISVKKFADFFEHLEKFRGLLTKTEIRLLENWILYVHLTDKELSSLMNLGKDTIKTHRYNILAKWGQYATENKIDVPLEKLLTAFYSD